MDTTVVNKEIQPPASRPNRRRDLCLSVAFLRGQVFMRKLMLLALPAVSFFVLCCCIIFLEKMREFTTTTTIWLDYQCAIQDMRAVVLATRAKVFASFSLLCGTRASVTCSRDFFGNFYLCGWNFILLGNCDRMRNPPSLRWLRCRRRRRLRKGGDDVCTRRGCELSIINAFVYIM